MTRKRTEPEIFQCLQNMGIEIRLCCGKWIVNGREYVLNGLGGLRNRLAESCASAIPELASVSGMDRFIKYMQSDRNEPRGEWPTMRILKKAREMIDGGYKPKELVYPLTEKELKLINYFLQGNEPLVVFFYGVGGSGKSTVANIIEGLFGLEDTSHCAFADLGNGFLREDMAGKRFWRDDDINANWSGTQAGTLKKIATKAIDQFNPKGERAYDAQYRCKGLLCCNVPPKFDVSDSGLLRRILYYKKDKKIENVILGLDSKVYSEEELLDIACAALLVDMTDWLKDFEEETHEVIMISNNVAKYGMCKYYELYVERCMKAGVRAFGEDKWMTLKELFASWGAVDKVECNFE